MLVKCRLRHVHQVAVRIIERSLRRSNIKRISNLIGRNNKQTTLTLIYSDWLQSYIVVSLFETQFQTERQSSFKAQFDSAVNLYCFVTVRLYNLLPFSQTLLNNKRIINSLSVSINFNLASVLA